MSEWVMQFLKRVLSLQQHKDRLLLLHINGDKGRLVQTRTQEAEVEEITAFSVPEGMCEELLAMRCIIPGTKEGEYFINRFAIDRLELE